MVVGVGIFLLKYVCSDFDGLLLVLNCFFLGGWVGVVQCLCRFQVFMFFFLILMLFCWGWICSICFFGLRLAQFVFFFGVCVFDVMGFCLGCGQYLIGRSVACSMIFQAFTGKIQEIIVKLRGFNGILFWEIRSWKCLFHKDGLQAALVL